MTLDRGKDRVVAAQTDAVAGPEFGGALTHDDITGDRRLAAVQFDAKAPTRRVATVTG